MPEVMYRPQLRGRNAARIGFYCLVPRKAFRTHLVLPAISRLTILSRRLTSLTSDEAFSSGMLVDHTPLCPPLIGGGRFINLRLAKIEIVELCDWKRSKVRCLCNSGQISIIVAGKNVAQLALLGSEDV